MSQRCLLKFAYFIKCIKSNGNLKCFGLDQNIIANAWDGFS